jgi:predicted transcriptional regulator
VQVQDVMTTRVVTIDATDSVDHARARMLEAGVHQLVVRGKRGRVVGVIGMADVRAAPRSGSVADFMPHKLLIVRPGTAVGSAAALMRVNAIGSLPVMRRNRLVGIVTVSDMLDVVDDADGSLDAAERRGRSKRAKRASRPSDAVFRNILVATDLTPGSARAVACARALALQKHARLHILYVSPDPIARALSTTVTRANCERRLGNAQRRALRWLSAIPARRIKKDTQSERSVAVGEPADQIAEYATRMESI